MEPGSSNVSETLKRLLDTAITAPSESELARAESTAAASGSGQDAVTSTTKPSASVSTVRTSTTWALLTRERTNRHRTVTKKRKNLQKGSHMNQVTSTNMSRNTAVSISPQDPKGPVRNGSVQ